MSIPPNNYERNGSHIHCWNQGKSPACGIPLEKHTQCCLCEIRSPTPCPVCNSIETPHINHSYTLSIEAIVEEFEKKFVDEDGIFILHTADLPILKSFLRTHLASFGASEYQRGLKQNQSGMKVLSDMLDEAYQKGLEEGKLSNNKSIKCKML